ncbi:MAG: DUF1800 family protein [Deltaproteobacteria bacterium]|nr:DUF1800 family protein [Deltaproteobacteria bacterium]
MIGAILLTVAVTTPTLAQSLIVTPSSVSVPLGGQRQFTAYYNSLPTTAVAWTINNLPGGNSTVGTISASGLYTAPVAPPAGYSVTVRATNLSNPGVFATGIITVRYQIPWPTGVSPNPLPIGTFSLQVFGSRFVNGASVRLNGVALPTTFLSSTLLSASATTTKAGSVSITVANPGPDAVSAPLSVQVGSNPTPTATRGLPTATPSRAATATSTMPMQATSTPPATRSPEPTKPATTAASPKPTTAVPVATPTATPTISVNVIPASASVQTGATQQFQATVSGSSNQAVTWAVDGTVGGDPGLGTITTSGLYTAPAAVPAVGSVTVSAVSVANPGALGTAQVSIQNPQAITFGRFLEQSTFGPTQQLTAHLVQVGMQAFLDEQFTTPESSWPALATAQRSDAVDGFFGNALSGQDQLRQRVIFALSEVIVEAMNKNTNGDEIVPWLQLLSRNAFGNYHTLLKELTLDASMGKYLDLANSGVMGGAANENYPREVMQLFSIGLYQLDLDGSIRVDAQNVPLPTYTQTDVQQLAKALTGWTYGNSTGTPPAYGNYNYYPGPMLPVASRHDNSAKTILGQSLPANQGIQADLDGAINILFNHPNVGPFIATRLIRALITGNPTPAYIARIATVFNNNGSGVRGDMTAVVRAILLDPEARNDAPPANFGRLRTPMQHTIALARALNLNLGAASQFAYLFYNMNEGLLDAASVFGHYSPTYHIPKTALFGPEFQIYSASDAINRANWFYGLMYNPWPINPALQPFVAVAGNAATLVNAVDNALLYGRMSPSTRTAILNALPPQYDNNARVLTALYLASMSGEYLIQR